MFINLALDRIVISNGKATTVVPFSAIDQSLPQIMVEYYRVLDIQQTIMVCNGPGSFTHLKTGVLALQTLAVLASRQGIYKVANKFSCYYNAYQHGCLPRYGLIYIGQRKSLARLDCEKKSWHMVPYRDLVDHGIGYYYENYFIDQYFGDDYPLLHDHINTVTISYSEQSIALNFCNTVYDSTDVFQLSESIAPWYAIEPTIG